MTKEQLDKIVEEIKAGKTLYIQTCTKTTKIDRKTVEKFEKIERPVLKISKDGDLLLSSGNSYVSCKYCRITLVG